MRTIASAGRTASGPFSPQAPQRGYRSVLVVGIGCRQRDLEIETGISILHRVGSPSYCVIGAFDGFKDEKNKNSIRV